MSTTIPVPHNCTANEQSFFQSNPSPELETMLDEWHRGKLWHDSAPRELREGWTGRDSSAAWTRWSEYLGSRKNGPLVEPLGSKADPLDWGLPADSSPLAGVAEWRATFDKYLSRTPAKPATASLEAMLAELLHDLRQGPIAPAVALEAVVVAHRLAKLAPHLTAAVWWRLVAELHQIVSETQAAASPELQPEPTLVHALLAGEMPLALSVLVPELKPFRALRSAARQSLGEGLLAATDGEGLVDAVLLPVLPTLFCSWTRAREMGEQLKKGAWSDSAETQYEWLVRQTVRLQRPDGSPMLSAHPFANWPAGGLDTAIDLAGDDQDDVAAAAHLAKVLPTIEADFHEEDLPDASVESEWSSLAVLANGWDKSASRVLVDYSQPEVRIEVESCGRTLLSGGWETETSFNGQQLHAEGEWDQQCWYSDDDCDFLDLSIDLNEGARLERQLFLGKDDGFLLAFDILHDPAGSKGEWRHTMRLPIFAGVQFAPQDETRDGSLVNGKGTPRASVLPLALAEWRVEPRYGELSVVDNRLELTQHAERPA